jgi:hypothetical protein
MASALLFDSMLMDGQRLHGSNNTRGMPQLLMTSCSF